MAEVDSLVAISIDGVGNLADTITKATLAAAAVVAVVVILIGLARAVRARLRQQLVISDTGPLPAAVAGSEGEANTLSPWLRQRVQTALAEQMEEAQGIVERVFSVDVALHRLPAELAVDEGTDPITSAAQDTLATVASGLRAVAPGQADGILGALSSALPKPRGCVVQTAPLLRGPADVFRLGLSIELHRLDGSPLAATTLWEPPAHLPTAPTLSGQERLVALIEPASHWVALRLAAQRLRATPARSLRRASMRARRSDDPSLDLQRLLAAALTLNAMRDYADHTLAFGAEALDDLRQIGPSLARYHRPAAIEGAVHEAMGFAYLKEHDEEKARRSFLAAREAWARAEALLAAGGRAAEDTKLADELERHRVRRIKCALLSGDAAAMAPATAELRDNPPTATADSRTLYSIACLYACAAERVELDFLPLAWEYLGRAVLATKGSAEWDLARVDPELVLLSARGRFLDDLSRTWSMRRARHLPPLVGSLAEAEVYAALARLSTPDGGPKGVVSQGPWAGAG
jgi:hypothetical protein